MSFSETRVCNRCGNQYTATWKTQMYCDDCKAANNRDATKRRRQIAREKHIKYDKKQAERNEYIKEKLRVIADFRIKRPPSEVLDKFYDLTVSDYEIDRFFRKLIDKKLGV